MKNCWILLVLLASIAACKDKKKTNTDIHTTPSTVQETKSYLPIQDFIQEDMRRVDSFAGGVLLRTMAGKKTDSFFIDHEKFRDLAEAFFMPELDSLYFHTHYTEASLMDETTQMLNFIYTADSSVTGLKKAMVYISPSLSIDKINRIYLEKDLRLGDTLVTRKMTWKMRQYIIIIENKQTPSGYDATVIRKAIWDPSKFTEE